MKRITDFQPNPLNPRKISHEQLEMLQAAMDSFGDLSGLVVNVTTGRMIGGHQRVKILGQAPVQIVRRFAKPTPKGTVAEGHVTYHGERFVYREVKWTEAREKAAMIAANKQGGDWDLPDLAALVQDLSGTGFEALLGFSDDELKEMFEAPPEHPGPGEDLPPLPENVRLVQLYFTVENLPEFMEQVRTLGQRFGTTDISGTVMRAVAECHANG
jgi:hypothetical protein